ncbi:sugar phosphate isomerase/epimerase [candidate division KSB1 bacterium]|nr:sugar phosphate isomerase/epimerase [candidate division KSB1 bacterium]
MKRNMFMKLMMLLFGTAVMMHLACINMPKKLDNVGLQLWSVRQAMQEDFKGTLIQIAEAGYDQVEFAGYYNHSPEEIKALLDSLGLTAPAAHVGYNLLSGENLQKTIEAAKIIGHEYLIMPSLPPVRPPQPRPPQGERRRRERKPLSTEEVKKIAAIFNEVGQACHDAGLKFAYHNHMHEFVTIDSADFMYDILLNETDPALVDFELDIGWAVAAGVDPLAYFEKYPGRFKLFHVKDMDEENQSVVVGKGTIDFVSIFAQSELAGAKYYVVEYEGREDPIASVAESVSFLKTLTF